MANEDQKPRSPTLNLIFEKFLQSLKTEEAVDEDVVARVRAALDSGKTITYTFCPEKEHQKKFAATVEQLTSI